MSYAIENFHERGQTATNVKQKVKSVLENWFKVLTKLSLMSRVLLRGRRFDSGGAGSNRVCNGWDWTHSACTIIRVAITSRPLKQVGRFILFSPFVWDNNLQCFYGISFFCCFFWKNNHFWNFAIRRQHFRDGCIEIRQRTSTAEEVSKACVVVCVWNEKNSLVTI